MWWKRLSVLVGPIISYASVRNDAYFLCPSSPPNFVSERLNRLPLAPHELPCKKRCQGLPDFPRLSPHTACRSAAIDAWLARIWRETCSPTISVSQGGNVVNAPPALLFVSALNRLKRLCAVSLALWHVAPVASTGQSLDAMYAWNWCWFYHFLCFCDLA